MILDKTRYTPSAIGVLLRGILTYIGTAIFRNW
jgi:hypothetical protein